MISKSTQMTCCLQWRRHSQTL